METSAKELMENSMREGDGFHIDSFCRGKVFKSTWQIF